jgi:CTP:molybdopterin cytidylyltransferase MocA
VSSVPDVIVVLGAHAEAIEPQLELGRARVVRCAGWAGGLAASLQSALAAAGRDIQQLLVLLGDQPRVSAPLIERVLEADPGFAAARATYDGVPGHPVLLRGEVLRGVPRLSGDKGARELLEARQVKLVEVGDLGDITDVDEPSQLATLSA